MQEHYDNFFEDIFVECEDKYGQVEEMNVCDNLGDHLVGNVYVKFKKEDVSYKVKSKIVIKLRRSFQENTFYIAIPSQIFDVAFILDVLRSCDFRSLMPMH